MHPRRQPLDEFGLDIAVDEDALRRDANLASVVVAALDDRLDDPVEPGAAVDDDRRRAAVLKRATRSRCELAAQIPANAGGADEAQESDARIGGEPLGQGVVLGDEGLAPRLREARLAEQGDQLQAGQRRRRSRLDDHGTPDGDGRRDLMDDQVERMVEGRDRGDDADRLPGGESPAAIARRREPHRDLAAGEVAELVGRIAQAVDRTDRLDPGVRQRLPAFLRDEPRKCVQPLSQQHGGADQNRATLVRLQGAVANLYEPERRLQPGLERGGVIGRDLLDQRPVISLNDLIGLGHDHASFVTGSRCASSSTSTRLFSE